MKIQHILMTFALLLSTTFLSATVYEDGTNGTNSWSIYDNAPAGASISSIYDAEKASDVIKLEGESIKNGYILGSWNGTDAWNNTTEKTLKLSMNFSENFYIFVSMQTIKGHRYVYYTQADTDRGLHNGSYIHYGLGAESKNGTWQTLSRDLEVDLKKYESDNSIVSVNAFLVRGSGLLDDIELKNTVISNIHYTVEEVNIDVHNRETNIYKHTGNSKILLKKIFAIYDSYTPGDPLPDPLSDIVSGYALDSYDIKTFNNITYFLVQGQVYGEDDYSTPFVMLWRTDGTVDGTILLTEFGFDYHTSQFETVKFTIVNGTKLYFEYTDSTVVHYWETDGTVAGTVELNTTKCDMTTAISRTKLEEMISNGEDVTGVNTCAITDMSKLFYKNETFNQDISGWDVSNVTDMHAMFLGAVAFNQPLDVWDVSNVTNMSEMFRGAHAFNQPIDSWDVSNVTNMSSMFYYTSYFNQPLGSWDVSKVTNMDSMFRLAYVFNQPIDSWDVSKVTNMSKMFRGTLDFNQSIESWDVSNVMNMSSMFKDAQAFSGHDLSAWEVK